MQPAGPDTEARTEFFQRAAEYSPVLSVETSDGFFFVSTRDRNIGMSLFVERKRGEFHVLRRALAVLEKLGQAERARAGPFVDVGANIGTSIVSAMKANGFTRGIALEPEPENHRLLRLNLAANDLADRVRILKLAVSDSAGRSGLIIMEGKSGGHRLEASSTGATETVKGRRILQVKTVTLDSLIDKSVIDADGKGLAWIDAQGSEGHILAGGERLFGAGLPVLLEVAPSHLRKRHGVDLLISAAHAHYTHFVDMRSVHGIPASRSDVRFRAASVGQLEDLVTNYGAKSEMTDIILINDDSKG